MPKGARAIIVPGAILALWIVWFVGVILHGNGSNWIHLIGVKEADYKIAGEFGDAFGSLGSLMAALAAAGAWFAVGQTRIQAFESTFYDLLGHLHETVNCTDIQSKTRVEDPNSGKTKLVNSDKFEGKDAFKRLLNNLRKTVAGTKCDNQNQRVIDGFRKFYDKYKDDLAHYFRIIYHIVLFIDRSSVSDKKLYANILRAQMSDSEQILLMYNCSVGKGRDKFKVLVEKYSLLHNASMNDDPDHWENALLRPSFAPTAFRDNDTEKWPVAAELVPYSSEAKALKTAQ